MEKKGDFFFIVLVEVIMLEVLEKWASLLFGMVTKELTSRKNYLVYTGAAKHILQLYVYNKWSLAHSPVEGCQQSAERFYLS